LCGLSAGYFPLNDSINFFPAHRGWRGRQP
jgi:hypothetical protein